MQLDEILIGLGLTEGEAKLYLKLLTLKEATASGLGKAAKVERRTAYDIVRRLKQKGLVSSIEKEGKTFYQPLKPNKLLDLIGEREENLARIKSEFVKVLPGLESVFGGSGDKVNAKVLSGKEGLKAMFMDELETGETIYIICTAIVNAEDSLRYFLPRFTKERIRRGIEMKILTAESSRRFLEKYGLVDIRFLPDEYVSPAGITIYGNKLAFSIWSGEMITVLIESSEVSESFRKYFSLIWNLAKN
ncbi:MAG: hypothetical protein JW727_03800 [Candidatus Aenigmarchaeota archaeon]|nr:hypothetical protein [Candidatus Aenigmarchaeota archaeon]